MGKSDEGLRKKKLKTIIHIIFYSSNYFSGIIELLILWKISIGYGMLLLKDVTLSLKLRNFSEIFFSHL